MDLKLDEATCTEDVESKVRCCGNKDEKQITSHGPSLIRSTIAIPKEPNRRSPTNPAYR